jgi:hypothetical protein
MNFVPASQLSVAIFLAIATVSCRSPRERVAERMETLRAEWQSNLSRQADLPERALDWAAALDQLRAHNLKLRQARNEVTNSHEAVRQVFRDLTPTLNLRAGVSKNLKSLGSTTIDDVTFSADSFFNIPGLVSFGARLYAARLFQLRAEAAFELTQREQIIELYKVFLLAQDTQLQSEHLTVQRSTAAAIREVDPITGQLLLTEAEIKKLTNERETESLQQRAAELLGSREHLWKFTTNGLPDLVYESDPMPLEDTNRVAQLQMKMVAIELEAARAQQNGIKLRYWPELNLFVSGPPIYQRAFGTDRFWDAGDLRASADLFWYLDTRGYVSRQLRQVRRQQTIQRERLRQESIALIDRLLYTQTLLQAVRDQAKQVDRELEVLKAVPPAQNYPSLMKYAEDYRALVEQQRQLRRELAELKTLFWFVDENAWRDFQAGPSLARALSDNNLPRPNL